MGSPSGRVVASSMIRVSPSIFISRVTTMLTFAGDRFRSQPRPGICPASACGFVRGHPCPLAWI